MVSAAALWRTPRKYNNPSLGLSRYQIASHVRCFGTRKGPPDDVRIEDSKGAKNQNVISKGLRRESPRQGTWGNLNQLHHLRSQRRPRFGPKSQKFFQAATNPQQKYGIRSLNLKLIKDSSNIPILIPGRILKGDEHEEPPIHRMEQVTDDGKQQQKRRRRRKLPIVNAAALLDTKVYCKKSAYPSGIVTKSGHEAAKRLLKGKKELFDMIRGNIIYQQSQRPFCLTGHGIPKQLLQDHIDMADTVLQTMNEPSELALVSDLDETDHSSPDSMIIRSKDGQSRTWAWPPRRLLQRSSIDEQGALQDISQSFDHSLVLYLAAMDRISKQLGPVGSYLNKASRKNWTVKMYRGMAYPIDVISRLDDEEDGRPVPILEWSPLNSTNSKRPHVSIRLQGTPKNSGTAAADHDEEVSIPNPVTLVYDAIFQEDPRVEPA